MRTLQGFLFWGEGFIGLHSGSGLRSCGANEGLWVSLGEGSLKFRDGTYLRLGMPEPSRSLEVRGKPQTSDRPISGCSKPSSSALSASRRV